MPRAFCHIAASPMPGDVIEIREGEGEESAEVMLRVLWTGEDHVAYKQYGAGRYIVHVRRWQERLKAARTGVAIRPGDHDMPF